MPITFIEAEWLELLPKTFEVDVVCLRRFKKCLALWCRDAHFLATFNEDNLD